MMLTWRDLGEMDMLLSLRNYYVFIFSLCRFVTPDWDTSGASCSSQTTTLLQEEEFEQYNIC